MGAFPTGTAARPAVAPLLASPATWEARPLLQAVPGPERSPEGTGDPSAGRSRTLTTAETDKLIGEVLARHTESPEAVEAFDDLNHGLLLAREKGEEVPCVGPGAQAWTSDDATDQELAADLCLLCPVFALCQRYADAAQPDAGTWAGVTREPSARERRRARYAQSNEQRRASRASRTGNRPARGGRRWNPGQRDCTCGCGGTTRGGFYLPGHDSTHLVALVAGVRAARLTREQALTEVAHSERLQAKLAARLGV